VNSRILRQIIHTILLYCYSILSSSVYIFRHLCFDTGERPLPTQIGLEPISLGFIWFLFMELMRLLQPYKSSLCFELLRYN
jgi:hypothetical protein